jgi:putative nucleotidyltransferase with HDIG domain
MGAATPGLVATAERKRILFVDDDQSLLDGLRDALRRYRHEWRMSFVESGEDALAALEEQSYDVVISDLRMPRMDGARLLELIRDQWPDAVRIVLSGHAEMKMVARAAAVAHRLIAKPCDIEDLAKVIEGSYALKQMAGRVELGRLAMGASALPSLPRLYAELTEVLSSGAAGATDAARVIERDMAMTAKVLQLANSAYFGRRSSVSKLSTAVAYLGMESLRALVLQAEAFQDLHVDLSIPGFEVEALQQHCTRVARLAAALAQSGARDEAFAAGLLHDVGLLVLASQSPDELTEMIAAAREQHRHISQIERERYGVTHAEIGAHLLALWGLPHTVTEAVAHHHDELWTDFSGGTASAVYLANILVEEFEAERLPDAWIPIELDLDYIERAGYAARLEGWRALAARILE